MKGVDFTKALIALGHEVEVLTGFPNYPSGKVYPGYRLKPYRRDTIDGVVVHRVALYPAHDNSSLRRILNLSSFALSAMFFGICRARKFDVICAYSPVTTGFAAVIAGWAAGIPVVSDIQDLWPDSVTQSRMTGVKRMAWTLHKVCDFVYRRSTRIITQSKGIKNVLIDRGVPLDKIDVIYNWADEEAAAPSGIFDVSSYGFENKFTFVYGGNLGRVQGLDTLIRAAHLAGARNPRIQLLLIGHGIEEERLRRLVADLSAKNVKIAPGVARNKIGDVFASASVLVLHLWNDPLFAITVPQKTQFYLAMGKPVLVGARGEVADIIAEAGAGVSVEPDNVSAMAEAMLALSRERCGTLSEMGKRARRYYENNFAFATAVVLTERALAAAVAEYRGIHPH